LKLFSAQGREQAPAGEPAGTGPTYETTVSALGRLVRTS
jgi:hypothetical protein